MLSKMRWTSPVQAYQTYNKKEHTPRNIMLTLKTSYPSVITSSNARKKVTICIDVVNIHRAYFFVIYSRVVKFCTRTKLMNTEIPT